MLEQLKRPLKKRYDKIRTYAGNFVGPVKESASKLIALFPAGKAFAGSEGSDDAEVVEGKGILGKLKSFKKSLKGLSDFQKLILLTIAVVLPAGILIAVALVGFLKKRKK